MYILVRPSVTENHITNLNSTFPTEPGQYFNMSVLDTEGKITNLSELSDLTSFLRLNLVDTFAWQDAISMCRQMYKDDNLMLTPFWVGTDWE